MQEYMTLEQSTISPSAKIHSPDGIEHPVWIGARTEVHHDVAIGAFSFVNVDTILYRNAHIGRYCSIARGCEIAVANHPMTTLSTHSFQYTGWMFPKVEQYKHPRSIKYNQHPKTHIGSDVWIGAQCIVKSGIKIGHGAVIAANSVVTKDVPPYAIVGGSIAKLLRFRFDHQTIVDLLETAWWELPYEHIRSLPFSDIGPCVKALRALRSSDHSVPVLHPTTAPSKGLS